MTRALTHKSVASDLIFTRYVNTICNEGIRGLACFSAYLDSFGVPVIWFIHFASAASAWRNQWRASVRAVCAVGWMPHAPLSCFVFFMVWPSSQNLCCELKWHF